MAIPSWNDVIFSVKAFAASMLALYIALAFDLPRPYWAMAAVYIVANPFVGSTRSKGVYRALGSVIGGTAAVIILPTFVNAPPLLMVAVALWTSTLLFLSMLDRSSRNYITLLAGYTLPLIALPLVDSPENIFDTAVARAMEMGVGAVCATVVNTVVLPASVRQIISGKLGTWIKEARQWAADIMSGGGAVARAPLGRQKLAADLASLDVFLSQLGHDPGTVDVARQIFMIRSRLLMMMPILSSLADRLHALHSVRQEVPSDIDILLQDISAWMRGEGDIRQIDTDDLRRRIEAVAAMHVPSLWMHLIRRSAIARLRELIDLIEDSESLHRQINTSRPDPHWRGKSRYAFSTRLVRTFDYPLMLLTCSLVAIGIMLAGAIWYFTAWEAGSGFVIMMAVGCSFFNAVDRPAPLMKSMFNWTAIASVLSGVYLFAILPAVHSFEMLVVVFAPPFLLLGLVIPNPKYFIAGLLTLVNTASIVALQNRFSADFESFASQTLGTLSGVGAALIWTLLTRPFGEEFAARRLVRAGWRDIANAASQRSTLNADNLTGRLLDRLGQLVPRLSRLEGHELQNIDGLAEARIGFNVVELQRDSLRRQRAGENASAIDDVLQGTAAFFRQRVKKGISVEPPDDLRERIDTAIKLSVIDIEKNEMTLNALIGLRRALFPDAPPPDGMGIEREPAQAFPQAAE